MGISIMRGRPGRVTPAAIANQPKKKVKPRIIIHGVGGIGKTSLAAQFPKPIFIQSRGETGLETLQSAGVISESIQIMPFTVERTEIDADGKPTTFDVQSTEACSWQDVYDGLEFLRSGDHDYSTLVFDVVNGIEKLLFQYVCERDFGNVWGEKGFLGYMRGYEMSLPYLKDFTNLLDDIRINRQMTIVMLAHSKVATIKNPSGPDYDRFVPDMHTKTWGWLFGWSDLVLFANRITRFDEKSDKPKAMDVRQIYAEATPAWDAKNRYGINRDISMGTTPNEAYKNLVVEMNRAKNEKKTA